MNQSSGQRGYVSEAIHTRKGVYYRIRYRVRNDDGSSTHKSERLYVASQRQARAILEERLRQAAAAARLSPTLCLRDFIFKYWWPYQERQGRTRSTRRSYHSIINNVVPPICLRPLAAVTPQMIQEVIAKRSREASAKTVLNEFRLLHHIFQLAVDLGLLEHSPVRREHRPRFEPRPRLAGR